MNGATGLIVGNLIKDPTHTQVNGQTVVSFTVAVNTTMKKADNTGYESNFYNVSMWGKPGEYLLERLQKGTQVEVVGDLILQKYTNKTTGESGQSLNIRAYKVTPLARAKTAPVRQASMDPDPDDVRPF